MPLSAEFAPADVHVYALPLRNRFRGIDVREGMLLRGPSGWGDFCPFPEYDDVESAPWLAAAWESAAGDWPEPVRDRVPVNVTVPAVGPQQAHELVERSGCRTAKVKVADHPGSLAQDQARLEAVRAALGPDGAVRADVNGRWDVDTAVTRIPLLDQASGGLQYIEQPCATLAELAAVRRAVDVPVAADESIRRAGDPLAVALAGAADVAVLKVAPLGGVRRSLEVAQACGLPVVVSSALESTTGMAAGLALAGALPDLALACGLGTGAMFTDDVSGDTRPVGAFRPVPRRAPDPDPVLLERVRAPKDRERWWLERLERVRGVLA